MFLKFFVIFFVFIFLVLLQQSFLPHIALFGVTPSLVFIFFFILVFFEQAKAYQQGLFCVLLAGLILDVFSHTPFGYAIISLLITYTVLKITIYFLNERQGQYMALYFVPLFLMAFILHSTLMFLFSSVPNLIFSFSQTFIVAQLAYNLAVALAGFFIYNSFSVAKPKQLTLWK